MKARTRTLKTAAALLVTCSLVSPSARADSREEAEAQFRTGVSLQRVDDFEAAITAYEASLRLHPTKSALFNLANCLKAAHRYPDALRAFEELLTRYGADLAAEMRSATEEQIRVLNPLVGALSLEITPDGADVVVDGHSVGRSPLPAPLRLAVGPHNVEATLDGHQTRRARVDVRSSMTAIERLHLVPATLPAPTPPPPPAITPTPRPAPAVAPRNASEADVTTTFGWVATGLGATLLLGGTGTGIWALTLDNDLADDCRDGHCPASRAKEIDRLETLVTASNVLFGAGAALAAGGIAVLVLPSSPGGSEQDTAAVSLDIGPNVLGARLWSDF